jgi:nucleosome assembly protein 1-like 1
MTKQNIIEKCDGTEISWKDGKDVTKKKIKKKSKNKKNAASRTVTKTVEQESFFNFFKTVVMPDETALAEPKPEPAGEEEEKDIGTQMDEDFDTGNDFKD